jgi:glutamate 5-kinase
LVAADGTAVARAAGYDAADLPPFGRKTGELPTEFRRAVVHRDDLALL